MANNREIIRGVYHALSRTGSTWLNDETITDTAKKLGVTKDAILNANGIVKYQGMCTTREIADAENNIAINLMSLSRLHRPKQVDDALIRHLVQKFEVEENGGYKLHYHQVDAVIMVVNSSFSVLTGGPGTGKTTVLRCIAYVLRALYPEISIAYTAPTGKAARRITESTGEYACTGHKKLGLGRDGQKTQVQKITERVLFMDESSMNDIWLTSALSMAIEGDRRLVFVGDVDQLPSVGLGAVLRDLIASKVIPVTMLTHTFRQDNESTLFANICQVRAGKDELIKGNDFNPILLKDGDVGQLCIDTILEQYADAIEKYGVEQVVCLLPYRRSGICSNLLNNQIQAMVNKESFGYVHTDADNNKRIFKLGDPVMQLVNRPECANGDVGKVIEVSKEGVSVEYTDCVVEYAPEDLNELSLAYAMSIHKSQGSEYACVIMALLDDHKAMLQRNLVYTGITRAKKECVMIYQKKALETAVTTIAEKNRITLLAEKLRSISAKYLYAYGLAS